MKVTMRIADRAVSVEQPNPGDSAIVAPGESCPHCNALPLRVAGRNQHIADHDSYEATALCLECRKVVGVLVATFSTVFGVEEDERVLNGRCRVY